MASTTRKATKAGKRFYLIRCHTTGGKELSRRWYIPDGWSERAIQRELAKVAAEFERQCKAGEVLTRAERKAQEEAARAEREEEAKKTLRWYAEECYLPAVRLRCTATTVRTKEGHLNRHILPQLGDKRIAAITPAMINNFNMKLPQSGLSFSTAQEVYATLRNLIRSAYMDEVIGKDPTRRVRPPARPKNAQPKQKQILTAEQLRQVLDLLEEEPLRYRALFWLLSDSGIRIGEALALRWNDVNFSTGLITISKTLSYTPESGRYFGTPKSGKSRIIDISPEVLARLREWRQEQSRVCLSEWIFTSASGIPLALNDPGRYLADFTKRNGLPHLSPHCFRHTFATLALQNGADVTSVSNKLGHAKVSTTLTIYSHATPESIKAAGDKFRKAVGIL